jgi:FkbM family methyltransferase
MNEFTFNAAFRRELKKNAHHYGEIIFLESVLRNGMFVLEGGANRGVTAIAMAKAVGDAGCVHAIEPVPEYFRTLKTNILRNAIRNISVYNLALSDRNGPIRFFKHGEGSGITRDENAETIRVKAITLPDFLSKHNIVRVDFINLDCEGSEVLVLREAIPALRKLTPLIFCEIHRDYLKALGQSVHDLVRILKAIGYTVRPVQVENIKQDSDFERCSHIFASGQGGASLTGDHEQAYASGKWTHNTATQSAETEQHHGSRRRSAASHGRR